MLKTFYVLTEGVSQETMVGKCPVFSTCFDLVGITLLIPYDHLENIVCKVLQQIIANITDGNIELCH